MRYRITPLLCLGLCLGLLAACGQSTQLRELKQGELPVVIAGTVHLACIAQAVAGDDAKVEFLGRERGDPHGYEPTAQDRRRLQVAHLLLVNGLGLESFDAAALAESCGVRLVDCSADIPDEFLIAADDEHEHDHGHNQRPERESRRRGGRNAGPKYEPDTSHDPHVWLSAEGAIHQARAIAKALGALDKPRARYYDERADKFAQRMQAILDEFKPRIAKLPNRSFATEHDAFSYFAREVGLGEAAFIKRLPGKEPSVEQRAKLEETLKKNGARAIFVEPGRDNKAAQEIAKSLGCKLAVLNPFESGKVGPEAFENVFRENLKSVLGALGD